MRVSLGMALIALIMVAIAENARIPVDNPATHLELTMVHEAMVLEYSGRHLALIDLSAELKLLLYVSLIACLFVPWGLAPPGAPPAALAIGVVAYLAKLGVVRLPARRVRDLDCQDARVPRAGIPGRGADARAAGHAAAVRVAEPVDAEPHLRHRPSARRLARAGELHAALPGPALCAAQRLRPACVGACPVGGLAGLCAGRAAPLHHRGDRAPVQGDRHPGGAAPHDRASSAFTARSRPWSASARPCCSAWGSSRSPWW